MPNELSIDSSHVKAHRSATGSKGEYQEAIGRSRGGRTCKIHCLADDRSRPVAIAPTRGSQAWTTDIIYIPMARGFVCLVAIVDWFSRRVLAWRLSITLETDGASKH